MLYRKPLPTLEVLHAMFDYEPDTGHLIRKTSRSQARAGDIAGCLDKQSGYFTVSVQNCNYRSHRIIWKMAHGVEPGQTLDHINRDRTDNRIANLRQVTQKENAENSPRHHERKLLSTNTSGYRGLSHVVDYYRKDGTPKMLWEATVEIDGKRKYIGSSVDKDKAIEKLKKYWLDTHDYIVPDPE